jgi:hypothetical protein
MTSTSIPDRDESTEDVAATLTYLASLVEACGIRSTGSSRSPLFHRQTC